MTKSLTKLQKKSQKQSGGAPPVMSGPRKKPPPPERKPVETEPAKVPGALQNATGARSKTSSNAGVFVSAATHIARPRRISNADQPTTGFSISGSK